MLRGDCNSHQMLLMFTLRSTQHKHLTTALKMYQFVETRTMATSATFIEALHRNRSNAARSIIDFPFNNKRLRAISAVKQVPKNKKAIVYWMSRDQRVEDNWALLYAQSLGLRNSLPLHVVFCLAEKFLDATFRHFSFMLDGLKEVESSCRGLNINFHLLRGNVGEQLPNFVKTHGVGAVVCDSSPLRIHKEWVKTVKENLPQDIPFVQVDSYCIVPVWESSDREEPAAFQLRKKLMPKFDEFLSEFPPVIKHRFESTMKAGPIDWEAVKKSIKVDRSVGVVDSFKPGYKAAVHTLESFINERLKNYKRLRNDPVQQHMAVSNLSPYFHFGQISAQRAVLEVKKYENRYKDDVESFINETVIWRELGENLCFYNLDYDNYNGAKDWAKASLESHVGDKREYVYNLEEFELAKTHDNLWNAAQLEMVKTGKMSGYMRMYWAKKILEWTAKPEEALKITIYLNDRYSLDGRDPNGYLGIMWSILGVNDRPFGDRKVSGKIRFMSYNACFQKFDAKAYIAKFSRKLYEKS